MKAGKIVYCVFILYNYFVSMSADWNPYAAENVAGSSSPQPINNVPDAASANDYPLGIQTNENSFVDNALFRDQDDFFSGLEMYEHFYENTVPPPANTVFHTVPVMSQTAQPSQIETIVVDLLSQISSSIQQAQGGDNIVELHGGPSIQTSVASSSSTEPVRHRRRRNSIDRTIVAMTSDELAADSGPWRKYGQKPIKGTPHPRHYYRCSKGKGCSAKKTVQRNLIDPNTFTVSYCGEHSHRHVTQRGSFAENTPNMLVLGDGNNNSINHPLQIGSLSSPGSGSNSTQSPPTMLGGANMQNNDAQMVEHRDDEYENLMMINDLMSNDIPIFIGLQDSNESSGVLMSPPWSPIFDDVFNFEDGDWGISKPK